MSSSVTPVVQNAVNCLGEAMSAIKGLAATVMANGGAIEVRERAEVRHTAEGSTATMQFPLIAVVPQDGAHASAAAEMSRLCGIAQDAVAALVQTGGMVKIHRSKRTAGELFEGFMVVQHDQYGGASIVRAEQAELMAA